MTDDAPEKRKIEAAGAPKPKRNSRKKPVTVADGPGIIMDMRWDDCMNDHLQKKVVSQISMAYSFDKVAEKSLPIVLTSVNQRWQELLHRVNAYSWNKQLVRFEQKPLTEVIPKEKIVYLTADTDNVCTSLEKDKYYVIGCILDHNSKKGVTREFALEHGIRMERLPIAENIVMDGRHVLTINHVAEILIRVANGKDWATAMVETIPQRKNPRKKEEKAEEEGGSWWCSVQ